MTTRNLRSANVCIGTVIAMVGALSRAQGASDAHLLDEFEARKRAEQLETAGNRKSALGEWLRVVQSCRKEAFLSCPKAKARVITLVRDETACASLPEARRLILKGEEMLLRRPAILCAIQQSRAGQATKLLRDLIVRKAETSDGAWARDVALPAYKKAGGPWPPLSARERVDIAVALRRTKRYDEALRQLRALDAERKSDGNAAELRRLIPFEIAITEFRAGALERAESGFKRLIGTARSPDQADGYRVWLASTFQKQGRPLDASNLFERIYARRAREDSSRPHLMRAIDALRKSSATERISRLYERLGTDFPNHAPSTELAFRAVRTLADARLFKLARAAAGRFVRRFAHHRRRADGEWMIAWATFKLGEWKRATALFKGLSAQPRLGVAAPAEGAAYWALVAAERAPEKQKVNLLAQWKRLADVDRVGFFGHLARNRSSAVTESTSPIVPVTSPMADVPAIERAFRGFIRAHPLAKLPVLRALTFMQKGYLDEADRELFRLQEQSRAAKGGPKVSVVPPPTNFDRSWMRRTARGILLDLNALHRILGNTNRVAQNLRFSYGYRMNGDDAWLRAAFPTPFSSITTRAAAEHRVPTDLIYAIMHTESSFTPDARSPADARGLMQVLPSTAKRIAERRGLQVAIGDLNDIARNIDFGVWYLRELLTKFHNQLPLAIAAYNGGPHNVAAWLDKLPRESPRLDEFLEDIPFRETRFYVRKVIAALGIYRRLYGSGGGVALSNVLDARYEDNINF